MIIVENFPKMGKEIATQVQETQRVPNRINPRQNTPRYVLIKLMKIKHKEQILKAAREKQQITHKGIPIRITADFSIEILQARREWQDILKVMKEKSESEVAQSCPTFSDPMDCSLPGSSVHGIFQARVLEWGAIAFSKESQKKKTKRKAMKKYLRR